jgi:predicted peptidase
VSSRMLCWTVALAVAGGFAMPVRAEDKGGKQQEKSFEKDGDSKVKFNYWLYLPPGYGKGEKVWPLVLFLHGAGETGSDIQKVKIHGPPKLAEGKKFPFILVSPQAPVRGWNPGNLNALLDDVMAHYKVDADRVYVTGLSMGGYGTWALAAAYPNKFAAIAPICGGGKPADAKKIKDLPIWVFHGGQDPIVKVAQSEAMVNALKSAGAEHVKFTVYPDAGHDSWTETYNNPDFYDWLLKQKRSGSKKE